MIKVRISVNGDYTEELSDGYFYRNEGRDIKDILTLSGASLFNRLLACPLWLVIDVNQIDRLVTDPVTGR